MFERVDADAREAGIDLTTGRQAMIYPTGHAHTLLRHARDKGTQLALKKALFKAYFQDGKNIADPGFLAELGSEHGFTKLEVERLLADPHEEQTSREDSEKSHDQGIRGVPFFVFDNQLALSGAQPESVFREALQRAVSSGSATASPPAARRQ
jgi:predicted DsbA family dithiol-disulfide isomerase